MKDFVFYSPTCVVFGKYAISQISELIAKKEYRHILIHYGGGSVIRNGILKARYRRTGRLQHTVFFAWGR